MDETNLSPSNERTKSPHELRPRRQFDHVVLLLQGGGALGAYQAGVYEALAQSGLHPNWVVGISIGAINAAIIAGNPPERRVERLKEFWSEITASPYGVRELHALLGEGDAARAWSNQIHAAIALSAGTPGFFKPRWPNPWLQAPGSLEATSYYDTGPLRRTIERLVDFDCINAASKDCRLSVGAVNVRSGNIIYFDSGELRLELAHIMASGALPPGFPAVEIEGELYWDGGLVSNTPLQWLVTTQHVPDSVVFQVDLWNARGSFPRSMAEVATRQKEIQYSSRTRAMTDYIKDLHKLRVAIADLLENQPEEFRQSEEGRFLARSAGHFSYNLIHLIYRPRNYEGDSKDYEFSRRSMEEHWRAGFFDAMHTLRHPEVLERPTDGKPRLAIFDLARDGSF